ncbi:hypothetical protein K469DRAFT_684445 [Zopfia rhizophila CBS 207.26]|uniref:Uncharacterized protein n=1 Tax=Zopfia rhizophila CBS 207.26 TaxID=1314779 RepID=A0A6A6DAW9_9PEZI|nr:hypothetical protein K469DRAFT_684445 [Zopfia rhizophila CBS 207.26]
MNLSHHKSRNYGSAVLARTRDSLTTRSPRTPKLTDEGHMVMLPSRDAHVNGHVKTSGPLAFVDILREVESDLRKHERDVMILGWKRGIRFPAVHVRYGSAVVGWDTGHDAQIDDITRGIGGAGFVIPSGKGNISAMPGYLEMQLCKTDVLCRFPHEQGIA